MLTSNKNLLSLLQVESRLQNLQSQPVAILAGFFCLAGQDPSTNGDLFA
jgi:hypothetical protein